MRPRRSRHSQSARGRFSRLVRPWRKRGVRGGGLAREPHRPGDGDRRGGHALRRGAERSRSLGQLARHLHVPRSRRSDAGRARTALERARGTCAVAVCLALWPGHGDLHVGDPHRGRGRRCFLPAHSPRPFRRRDGDSRRRARAAVVRSDRRRLNRLRPAEGFRRAAAVSLRAPVRPGGPAGDGAAAAAARGPRALPAAQDRFCGGPGRGGAPGGLSHVLLRVPARRLPGRAAAAVLLRASLVPVPAASARRRCVRPGHSGAVIQGERADALLA